MPSTRIIKTSTAQFPLSVIHFVRRRHSRTHLESPSKSHHYLRFPEFRGRNYGCCNYRRRHGHATGSPASHPPSEEHTSHTVGAAGAARSRRWCQVGTLDIYPVSAAAPTTSSAPAVHTTRPTRAGKSLSLFLAPCDPLWTKDTTPWTQIRLEWVPGADRGWVLARAAVSSGRNFEFHGRSPLDDGRVLQLLFLRLGSKQGLIDGNADTGTRHLAWG